MCATEPIFEAMHSEFMASILKETVKEFDPQHKEQKPERIF